MKGAEISPRDCFKKIETGQKLAEAQRVAYFELEKSCYALGTEKRTDPGLRCRNEAKE